MSVYVSVGDPATREIDQFVLVVAGKCPDEIEGDFDRYGINPSLTHGHQIEIDFASGVI